MGLYLLPNGPRPTTAAQAVVTTGTVIKTLLQVKMGATITGRIVEWGISFDGSAAATPIKVELLQADVAATVTAFVANDIVKQDGRALMNGDPTTDIFEVGVSASGYTGSAEGSITATRMFDVQLIAPTNQYVKQFPLGREPLIEVAKFARIRVTAGAAVNAYAYMVIEV